MKEIKSQIEREFRIQIFDKEKFEELLAWSADEWGGWEAAFEIKRFNLYLDTRSHYLREHECTLSLVYNSNISVNGKNKFLFKRLMHDSDFREEFAYEFESETDIEGQLLYFIEGIKKTVKDIDFDKIKCEPIILLHQTRNKRGLTISGKKIYISFDEVRYYYPIDKTGILDILYFCEFEADPVSPFDVSEISILFDAISARFNGKLTKSSKADRGFELIGLGRWKTPSFFKNTSEWYTCYKGIRAKMESSFLEPEDMFLLENLWLYSVISFYTNNSNKLFHNMYAAIQQLRKRVNSPSEPTLQRAQNEYNEINKKLRFNSISDSKGNMIIFDRQKYSYYLASSDREIRYQAFTSLYREYKSVYERISKCYILIRKATNIDIFEADIPNKEERISFINQLISSTDEKLILFQRYICLRNRRLKLKDYSLYDLQCPVWQYNSYPIPFALAKTIILDAFSSLGNELVDSVDNLFNNGQIDMLNYSNKKNGTYTLCPGHRLSPYISVNLGNC